MINVQIMFNEPSAKVKTCVYKLNLIFSFHNHNLTPQLVYLFLWGLIVRDRTDFKYLYYKTATYNEKNGILKFGSITGKNFAIAGDSAALN